MFTNASGFTGNVLSWSPLETSRNISYGQEGVDFVSLESVADVDA